jgi:hypothetical protein
MIPVKAPPIIVCTALYIIFIGNNLLIPLMNLAYNLLFKPFFMEVKPLIIIGMKNFFVQYIPLLSGANDLIIINHSVNMTLYIYKTK